ncbi:MAG: SDR family NAD(P)-dependent oxidoreductase [Alphaproteobacteria bacterium]
MLLKDKVCVITGAASARGIGRGTAKMMAEHGAYVVILDLDGEAANATAAGITQRGFGLACDVTDPAACRRAVEDILERAGCIDVLVNNAGVSQPLKLMDISRADYDKVLDVSLRGTLNMSQAVTPSMRSRRAGSIVCIASVSGQQGGGLFGGPHYCAAKAGVMGLARAMARELGPDNIRVNSIAPSWIDTDITAGMTDEAREKIIASVPLGRGGRTEDVAGAIVFLASDLSAYITGTTIDVNGGSFLHP